MILFAKETYGDTHHLWYQVDLLTNHEFGLVFNTNFDLIPGLARTIEQDIQDNEDKQAIYWYFGRELDQILLMIRFTEDDFLVQVNLKDFDFALNSEAIEAWKVALVKEIAK